MYNICKIISLKWIQRIHLSPLSRGVSCVSVGTGFMMQAVGGGVRLHQSQPNQSHLSVVHSGTFYLEWHLSSSPPLIPECTARLHNDGVVVRHSTAGSLMFGVSFEDSLLCTLLGSCGALWVVSSAFRCTAFSSDTLQCLDQSLGSSLSVCLFRITHLFLWLPANNLPLVLR